ncbi:UNVERIFIED_ORG: putative ATPase [Burkholderia sp. 1595]|uniref:ATPase n=1 Tax=Paraburkholderia terricola TaxID=169427 RepID=A0ABU1LP32_9BURK|nr:AAA family ATPase [Paraburkholderia terricola]MDR6408469.1 putative ATPase [Paraburkholderia terricola]
MRYVYINNFRGFSHSLIPLDQVNFLVGENSTGKSSFLNVLALVNNPAFWFSPVFALRDQMEHYSFDDFVSAWAKDKSYFQIGVLQTTKEKGGKIALTFNINEFCERDGELKLLRHYIISKDNLKTVLFEKNKTRYKTLSFAHRFASEDEATTEFLKLASSLRDAIGDLKSFPKDVPPNAPLPLVTSVMQNLESGGEQSNDEFKIEIPMSRNVIWIAPIRTKPKRIYDGIKIGYSPEGEHAPVLLRETLLSRAKSKTLATRLKEFGDASGLFETIVAHSFGRGAKNPFELMIRFAGAELNINNVGYGVSQALPLVVEFLTSDKSRMFSVQQPEVHLHPRAQAALGGLIFELAKDQKHAFFIETHSDYLIDRYRLSMRSNDIPPASQILFFNRTSEGNKVFPLKISKNGQYPMEQPNEFRDFFVREEMKLLGL